MISAALTLLAVNDLAGGGGSGTVCDTNKTFFGIPTWYKYLPQTRDALGNCAFDLQGLPNGYWLIGFGILDMILRVAALVAIGVLVYGGVRYIMSQGEPDNTRAALLTVINGLIGLIIAVVASGFVSFIANTLI